MITVVRLNAACRVFVAVILFYPSVGFAQVDLLPSWNDGAVKQAIAAFVGRVTKQGSADFVPPAERIATFDNDGTFGASSRCMFRWRSCLTV